LGKGGGEKPRGSPRSRFDGLEVAWEGPAGQSGGARLRPPRRREKLRRAGAGSGNARQGRRPRGPREGRGRLDSDGRTGRARSPSGPYGGRRRREAVGGEEQVRRGRSSERPLFIVDKRSRPATTRAPALTRRTACPLTGAHREPAADRWATSSVTAGEDQGSTWRGTDSRGPRSAPHLGQCGLGTARGP
jgi:hypothetical protein